MKMNFFFIAALLFVNLSCSKEGGEPNIPDPNPEPPAPNAYNEAVLADNPVGFWLLSKDDLKDASSKKLNGSWKGEKAGSQKLPNGDEVPLFNGTDSYYEIADADHLEVSTKGVLTIEAWMSPSVSDFPSVEKDKDYIHWMGKGTPGQHSWAARMYNKDSWRENRPQRISGYAFNLEGGLGAGSYFQEPITTGTWVHYVLVINSNQKSTKYPGGYTKLYRDGQLKDQDDLSAYNIVPKDGTAPTRIGTRDLGSFFKGAIGKVAIYDYELSAAKIKAHFNAMK